MAIKPFTTTRETLRSLRLTHAALIVTVLLYVFYIPRVIPQQAHSPVSSALLIALAILSAAVIGFGIFIRKNKIEPAFETLQRVPDDLKALGQWRIGATISSVLAESIGLYGLVIYMVGGTLKQAAPFFVVSVIVMLLWWPRQP
jgi:hypothetical protein